MSNASKLPYFVCTLGEAQERNIDRPFRNVNDLIQQQRKAFGDKPALGAYRTHSTNSSTSFEYDILTFDELQKAVVETAQLLSDTSKIPQAGPVGLLCSSSPEFLLTWLAFVWLGCPVLLIAPHCSPAGVRHLCKDVGVSLLLFDEKNSRLAREAATEEENGSGPAIPVLAMPLDARDIFKSARVSEKQESPPACTKATDVAYFHHTSGTSSGVPKPIPQSHHGAVGALPALDGSTKATFTTTPLYHGGPADIFRAWASAAMIWLFPSHEISITASNIIKCLECAHEAGQELLSPPIKYFASVPYVLQMMTEDERGLEWLKEMDLVGVGGAALPTEVGNELVGKGVNLVSRFGSAECGFMLSSHRQYENDKAWQHFRPSGEECLLGFEPRPDGLAELVVTPRWPHMAKRNRDDGSFATSDLFDRHPSIENAYKYHSRADAQLTLITGKKFDPEPVENAIVAASKHVSDVLVFGRDKAYPGALLFRSRCSDSLSDDKLVQAVTPIISKLNQDSEQHARISADMLVAMPYCESPLPKSSKGTVIRNAAEETFADQINQAYQAAEHVSTQSLEDSEIPEAVTEILRSALAINDKVSRDTKFFDLGVDSIAAMRIRNQLRALLPETAPRLPISIVEDAGNVKGLIEYLIALRNGREIGSKFRVGNSERDLMRRLVEQYSTFNEPSSSLTHVSKSDGEVVVMTGATGALGAHVLNQLRQNPRIARIYCLVRGADSHAAHERVNKALNQRQLSPLGSRSDTAEIVALQAVLGDPNLGLTDETYNEIAQEATVVMHLAWSVNFQMRLQSFLKDSIASVQNLINLALISNQARYVFCSSVASAMNYASVPVPERILDEPSAATNLGYSQSKWVAEHICQRASELPKLRGKVSIFRVGQLSGDSETGIWNTKEAWPLLLSTVKLTDSLPNLENEPLDWLPVDVAAAAMIEGALSVKPHNEGDLAIYHLLNDTASTTWSDMLSWARKKSTFEIVDPDEWIRRLEQAVERGSDQPALQLLDHWKNAFGDRNTMTRKPRRQMFETATSRAALPTMSVIKPVDEAYFSKLWEWIDANMQKLRSGRPYI